jgi:hypothetical protein
MEISGTLINLYREREKKGRSGGVMVRDDEGVKKKWPLLVSREKEKKIRYEWRRLGSES